MLARGLVDLDSKHFCLRSRHYLASVSLKSIVLARHRDSSLHEQYGIGWFDDDDYCLRAIAAGYRAVIAGDAFVHHYGGHTFLGAGVDTAALARENQRRFLEKWTGNGPGPPSPGLRPTSPTRGEVGDNAAANHNLGTLLVRCQRHDEAVVAYRQALRYRPNNVPTYQYLACSEGKWPAGGSRGRVGAGDSRGAGERKRGIPALTGWVTRTFGWITDPAPYHVFSVHPLRSL